MSEKHDRWHYHLEEQFLNEGFQLGHRPGELCRLRHEFNNKVESLGPNEVSLSFQQYLEMWFKQGHTVFMAKGLGKGFMWILDKLGVAIFRKHAVGSLCSNTLCLPANVLVPLLNNVHILVEGLELSRQGSVQQCLKELNPRVQICTCIFREERWYVELVGQVEDLRYQIKYFKRLLVLYRDDLIDQTTQHPESGLNDSVEGQSLLFEFVLVLLYKAFQAKKPCEHCLLISLH